jgi:hypothetical protein
MDIGLFCKFIEAFLQRARGPSHAHDFLTMDPMINGHD